MTKEEIRFRISIIWHSLDTVISLKARYWSIHCMNYRFRFDLVKHGWLGIEP